MNMYDTEIERVEAWKIKARTQARDQINREIATNAPNAEVGTSQKVPAAARACMLMRNVFQN